MSFDAFISLPAQTLVVFGTSIAMITFYVMFLFFCYLKLESMEARLNRCRLVAVHSSFWGCSHRGRVVRLCAVYCAIALPQLNARRGIVDLEQVRAFPRKTKILLHIMSLLCTLSLVGMVVAATD